jgi:hypothetical protein
MRHILATQDAAALEDLARTWRLATGSAKLQAYYTIGKKVIQLSGATMTSGHKVGDLLTEMAPHFGWTGPRNLEKTRKFAQAVDAATLKQILAARRRGGQPVFTWRSIDTLLTVPDATQRQRLIQFAIEQGQTSDEFKRCEKRLVPKPVPAGTPVGRTARTLTELAQQVRAVQVALGRLSRVLQSYAGTRHALALQARLSTLRREAERLLTDVRAQGAALRATTRHA